MFKEFDSSALEQWKSFSSDERKDALDKGEVQIAINIEIKIESHQKIYEEHKYYQVTTGFRLINDIIISSISEKETILSVKTFKSNNKPELISIKTNEEKVIENGSIPYNSIYKIKVSDITYGMILEL